MSNAISAEIKPPIYCSFCGKREQDVWKIVAGPCVFICDQCVILCGEILELYTVPGTVESAIPAPGEPTFQAMKRHVAVAATGQFA